MWEYTGDRKATSNQKTECHKIWLLMLKLRAIYYISIQQQPTYLQFQK